MDQWISYAAQWYQYSHVQHPQLVTQDFNLPEELWQWKVQNPYSEHQKWIVRDSILEYQKRVVQYSAYDEEWISQAKADMLTGHQRECNKFVIYISLSIYLSIYLTICQSIWSNATKTLK